jgi:hypothetical protein
MEAAAARADMGLCKRVWHGIPCSWQQSEQMRDSAKVRDLKFLDSYGTLYGSSIGLSR